MEKKSKNGFVIAQCALYGVGVALIGFSRYYLTDSNPTALTNPTFSSLKDITVKEASLNVSRNTNSLTTTIIGLIFIVVALLVEFFELFTLYITPDSEFSKENLFLVNCGPAVYMVGLVFCLSTLHETSSFQRIVHNQVGKTYYILMHCIPIVVVMIFLILLYHFFYELSLGLRSATQFVLGVCFIVFDYFLYQTLHLNITDG
jgi:hypothetical protein